MNEENAVLRGAGSDLCPGVELIRDVEVQHIGNFKQTLWVYRPSVRDTAPGPAMFYVHGGGFASGEPSEAEMFAKHFALDLGMTTFSLSYRLARTGATFPHAIQDVADAMRWVLRNVDDWNISADRIVVAGGSAGATLALLATLTQDDAALGGGGQISGPRIHPSAIASYCGPLDFVARWFDNGERPGAEATFLGCDYPENPALYHRASPLTHVRGCEAPLFLGYGSHDPVVHPRQGHLAKAAWEAHGIDVELSFHERIGHEVVDDPKDLEQLLVRSSAFLRPRL